jgi:hypothetical protein
MIDFQKGLPLLATPFGFLGGSAGELQSPKPFVFVHFDKGQFIVIVLQAPRFQLTIQ